MPYLDGLETQRLITRRLEPSDIPSWEAFFENNPSLPYLGLDLSLDKHGQSADWIQRQLQRYENNKFGHQALIDKESHAFIGQCGLLTQEVEGKTEIEIGYHILPAYWGNGYATEASMAFRDFAFNNDVSPSLISVIDVRNLRSQRVAEKIGMQKDVQIKLFGLDVFIYRIEK